MYFEKLSLRFHTVTAVSMLSRCTILAGAQNIVVQQGSKDERSI